MDSYKFRKEMYGWGWDHEEFIECDPLGEERMISIVIPTLNHGETIEDTILSIVNQGDKNYEIIVMDGGSLDNTHKVIDQYREYIAHYESRQDNGQSEAINRGFTYAKGDIYAWINSDDYYLPNAFRNVRQAFKRNNGVDIVVGSGDVVTRDCKFLKAIKGFKMERQTLLGWHNDQWIMQQCCFWTKDIWNKYKGVDESLHLLMDYDLWLRFAETGRSVAIEDRIAIMRYYKEAKTIALRGKKLEEEAYVYAKNKAFDELRKLVRELCISNASQADRIGEYETKILTRILRKIKRTEK
jgi:glycosyltransferase involved in cell wall biosynthesis